jgi:hypothetical protein
LVRELKNLYLTLSEKEGCPTVSKGDPLAEQDLKGLAVAAGSENKQES